MTARNIELVLGLVNGSSAFNGVMDQFCVWERALTDDEMIEHYNDGAGVNFLDL